MKAISKVQEFFFLHEKTVRIILCLMYLAGIIGLANDFTGPLFRELTSFNLWVSLFILLIFHENWEKKAIFTFLLVAILSFIVEVLGVNTGKIFGQYSYGKTLGFKVWETPIAIGANWLILCYCTSYFGQKILLKISTNDFVIALFSSILMVSLDFFIEPVAIHLDFWAWQNISIPDQNYWGWFLISFALNLFILKAKIFTENKIVFLMLSLQVLFFLSHNIIQKLV